MESMIPSRMPIRNDRRPPQDSFKLCKPSLHDANYLPLVSREWRNGNYYRYHYYDSSIPY